MVSRRRYHVREKGKSYSRDRGLGQDGVSSVGEADQEPLISI